MYYKFIFHTLIISNKRFMSYKSFHFIHFPHVQFAFFGVQFIWPTIKRVKVTIRVVKFILHTFSNFALALCVVLFILHSFKMFKLHFMFFKVYFADNFHLCFFRNKKQRKTSGTSTPPVIDEKLPPINRSSSVVSPTERNSLAEEVINIEDNGQGK